MTALDAVDRKETTLDLLRAACSAHLAVGLSWPATAAAYLDAVRHALDGLLPQITPAKDEPGRPPLDLEDLLEPARARPHTTQEPRP